MSFGALSYQIDQRMILHFLSDDKFSDYVIDQFSEPEMCSEFVLMSDSESREFFHNDGAVKHVNPNDAEDMARLMSLLVHYAAVVLHGLFFPWCETVLRNVPDNVKVAWVFWGGEIYGRKDLKDSFLSKRSKMLFGIYQLKKKIEGKEGRENYELPLELFNRIDYCLTDIHEDFEFVTYYTQSRMKEVWYNYYSIDETIGELRNQCVEGDDILVGNSSSLTCNHLDGFRAAKRLHNDNSEIIVPLSYGEHWLRNSLLKKGTYMFGRRFHPLVDFMPRDEYNKLIKKCAVVIMPHYRPQAFGNIITALWLGSRVFLSEKSPLYTFFKRIGIVLFSIETDINRTKSPKVLSLSGEEREENRRILASLYEKSVMNRKNQELVKILEQIS